MTESDNNSKKVRTFVAKFARGAPTKGEVRSAPAKVQETRSAPTKSPPKPTKKTSS